MARADYRETLRALVRASSGPYGYTLTLWSSGMIAIDRLGHPGLAGVLLVAVGGVSGFMLIESIAHGSLADRELAAPGTGLQSFWANAHLVAIAAAVLAVWAVSGALERPLGWFAAGFLATSIYLAGNAAQATIAMRSRRRGEVVPDAGLAGETAR